MGMIFEANHSLPKPCVKTREREWAKAFSDFLDGRKKGPCPEPPTFDPPPRSKCDIALAEGITRGLRLTEIEKLLDAGANMNAPGKDGYTPLHLAILAGRPDCATLLLDAGAKLDMADDYGNCAIHYAETATLPLLLAHGADVNMPGNLGYRPLHYAIAKEDAALVNAFLGAGADPAIAGDDGRPALMLAISQCDQDMTFHLIGCGIDVGVAGNGGDTPLHAVIRSPHILDGDRKKLVPLLLQAGANPAARNAKGETPMTLVENRPEIRKLIRQWAKPENPGKQEQEGIAEILRQQRKLGSLRPKGPSL